jgi:hypothetical protein
MLAEGRSLDDMSCENLLALLAPVLSSCLSYGIQKLCNLRETSCSHRHG